MFFVTFINDDTFIAILRCFERQYGQVYARIAIIRHTYIIKDFYLRVSSYLPVKNRIARSLAWAVVMKFTRVYIVARLFIRSARSSSFQRIICCTICTLAPFQRTSQMALWYLFVAFAACTSLKRGTRCCGHPSNIRYKGNLMNNPVCGFCVSQMRYYP